VSLGCCIATVSALADLAGLGPVLAVVAHPDDESFGLGAVLAGLAAAGAEVRVLCLTHGEASTLGARADLADVRRAELAAAAARLGVRDVVLEGLADGSLADQPTDALDAVVEAALGDAALVVTFEPNGVTGHPDHRAASAAARRVARARGRRVLEWGVSSDVALALRAELGVPFHALDGPGTLDLVVDRSAQLAAVACHESQSRDNPVLDRRLALQGRRERVRLR